MNQVYRDATEKMRLNKEHIEIWNFILKTMILKKGFQLNSIIKLHFGKSNWQQRGMWKMVCIRQDVITEESRKKIWGLI